MITKTGDRRGPLSHLRVVDPTQFLSGPYVTQILGDLGAEVIKIEAADGDMTRVLPPHFVGTQSAYYLSINRNKRSLAIDMKTESGQRADAQSRARLRRGGGEFPPRHPQAARALLRRHRGAEAGHHLVLDLRLCPGIVVATGMRREIEAAHRHYSYRRFSTVKRLSQSDAQGSLKTSRGLQHSLLLTSRRTFTGEALSVSGGL
jgi:hypothetical protein